MIKRCFSSCPDEEGTESWFSFLRRRGKDESFSSCPDEEGTERLGPGHYQIIVLRVSAVVPMRRELKASTPWTRA